MREYKVTVESYNKIVREYAKNIKKLRPRKEAKIFLSLLDKNSLILDLGCGTGRDAKIFVDKGFKVIGVDLSRKMIQHAKKSVNNADFKVMNMLKLNFSNNYFDAIWANAAFCHIKKKDIPNVIKKCYKILRKSGIFYLCIKEGKGELFEADKRYGGVKKFWSFFQKKEIKKILKKTGFKIIKSYVKKPKIAYETNPWVVVFSKK